MARLPELERGRQRFSARDWPGAYSALASADQRQALAGEDLERLATAAYLAGEDRAAIAAWTRAEHLYAERTDERAAYLACWISMILLLAGDVAPGTGWLSRARRLLKGRKPSAAHSFALALEAIISMRSGASSVSKFAEASAVAQQAGDADVLALSLLGQGQALVDEHRYAEGRTLLDEAMIGVSAGDVSPIVAGVVYCAVILTCQNAFDSERAREWTKELDSWCATQQGLRPFRGRCLVHRSEILQRAGDWAAAGDEAASATEHLQGSSEPVVGYAYYQRGELSRLRGDFDEANRLYRAASEHGHEPQPGAALLMLAEGRIEEAATSIRSVLEVAGEPSGIGRRLSRPGLLAAFVEIQLAAGNADAAAQAADELARRAEDMESPLLLAESRQALGAVLVARGKATEALAPLREAWAAWQRLEMPYEAARTRVLIGRACEEAADPAAAKPHYEAAGAVFARIGAAPDEAAVNAGLESGRPDPVLGLTRRECEVLGLVTKGAGNREIAESLAISEHTVARHVSNIFDKLGVNSRTAASAVAHAHHLV